MVDSKVLEEIKVIAGSDAVLQNEPMSRHTTFRTGGPAELLVMPDLASLPLVVACCRRYEVPFLVIGNGSNLLCGDGGVDGVVIEIGKRMAEICIDGELVHVQAGALLSGIAVKAAEKGLTGFEFAAGIPGSIGGAVVMNAGAYGGELKDVLREVQVLTEDGEILTVPSKDLELSYRHSIVPERKYIVLSAVLSLHL